MTGLTPVKLIGITVLVLGAIVVALILLGFEIETYPPKRPVGLPSSAEWAGGRDGGAWIDCEKTNESLGSYRCSVYNETGLSILDSAPYRMFSVRWDEVLKKPIYSEIDFEPQTLEYNSYGNGEIRLTGNLVLRRVL